MWLTKHSRATTAKVELLMDNGEFRLIIDDDTAAAASSSGKARTLCVQRR
jgi:signal transduction histidine kinase